VRYSDIDRTRKIVTAKSSRNNLVSQKAKSSLSHSQSNDALLRLRNSALSKEGKNRDLSANSKNSNNIPHLNLSEITNGSPVSTYRFLNSHKHAKQSRLNTTASNVSFSNSINGMFRNSIVGDTGEGSSKY